MSISINIPLPLLLGPRLPILARLPLQGPSFSNIAHRVVAMAATALSFSKPPVSNGDDCIPHVWAADSVHDPPAPSRSSRILHSPRSAFTAPQSTSPSQPTPLNLPLEYS
jgi:hypothetical protein